MLEPESPILGAARWRDRTDHRLFCCRCRRPRSACYCSLVRPFASEPRFIILSQPREAKHRLGTGRMAHLCLANSSLFEGVDFSCDDRVNCQIEDAANRPVLLHLAPAAINLSRLDWNARQSLFPGDSKPVVFVLDGTWKSIRKMLRLSKNLARLPMICFDPPTPSAYGFRREPRPQCYSTIEAIHHIIDLFAVGAYPQRPSPRPHDGMLAVFRSMVDRQLTYTA